MTKKEYLQAISLLNSWAFAYYSASEPLATDDEYDVLYHKVLDFEESNHEDISLASPTQRINGGLIAGFDHENHEERMYSLKDVFDEAEFLKWYDNLCSTLHSTPELYCENKFDGASLNLKYENGLLTTALTRGDGIIGDVVTPHAFHISGIPHSIPVDKAGEFTEIRGEVVILHDDFEKIQANLIAKGEDPFKNSRNAAAGALHSLNPSDCADRKLTFLPYGIGAKSNDTPLPDKQMDRADFIVSLGFNESGNRKLCATPAQAIAYFHDIMDNRDNLSMRIDGIVLKVNNIADQNVAGFNRKYPKWACAWKPPANEKSTVLKAVELTVGKNGQITPVGIVEPIEFNDATVSRVTFSNFDKIREYDLHVNDTVIIIKSGDIIPKLIGVLKDRRPSNAVPILAPRVCPTCGAPTEKRLNKDGTDSVAYFCSGSSCPSKAEGLLTYIVSKPVLNIYGMGEKTAIQLVRTFNVNDVLGLLKVTVEEFEALDGFAHKKAIKTFESVQSIIGNISYDKVLVLLNIHGLGKSISKDLAIEHGLNVFKPEIMRNVSMHGVDSDIFTSLALYLESNQEYVSKLIETLKPIPVEVKESEWAEDINIDGKFAGQTICITGTLDHPRSHYASIIESEGGTFVDKVKKGVDILVLGDKVGKTKIEKAEKMGIKCIPYLEFF